MKTFACALAAVGLISAPALAGGILPAPAPMAPPLAFAPQYDWTGFSVGAQLGYGDVDSNVADLDGDDAIYGLRAYYDYDFGRFVLGAGVQYDGTSITLDDGGLDADVDSISRVGLRAGIDSGRNWYYATAGYANAEVEGDNADGYFAGLGYEVFVTESVTAGAEVLYHEFEDSGVDIDATTATLSVNYRF